MPLIMKKKLLTIVIVLNISIALIVLFIIHDNFMSVMNDGRNAVKELKKSSGIPTEIETKINNYWENIEYDREFHNQQAKYKGSLTELDKKNIFWLEELKKGGYIILFRHAEREKWSEAVYGFDAYEVLKKLNAREHSWYRATCLTERGIETAKMIGFAFNHAEIEIQKIFSSPSCRARETAVYAFGRIDELHNSLLHFPAYHPLDRPRMMKSLKNTLLNFNFVDKKNLVLSAHNSVFSYHGLIDEWEHGVSKGLKETGFFILEKKNNKLIVRHRFKDSATFNHLVFRSKPQIKICPDPYNPELNCQHM